MIVSPTYYATRKKNTRNQERNIIIVMVYSRIHSLSPPVSPSKDRMPAYATSAHKIPSASLRSGKEGVTHAS